MKYIVSIAALLFVSCEKSNEERRILTQSRASTPSKVATLPDGRKLYYFYDELNYAKVYFAGDVVTTNYKQGKADLTTVFIGGVEYAPVVEKEN